MTTHRPCRVQLKRTKGWRMPTNTVKVDRTTAWGNHPAGRVGVQGEEAVRLFVLWVKNEASDEWKRTAVLTLKGKHLACWCNLGEPCHADYLLSWMDNVDPLRE
jgi:Domain of unknown function (DUF4326)